MSLDENINENQQLRGRKPIKYSESNVDDDGYIVDSSGIRVNDEKKGRIAGKFGGNEDDVTYDVKTHKITEEAEDDAEDEVKIGGLVEDDLSVVEPAAEGGKASKKRNGEGKLKNDDDYNREKPKKKYNHKHNLKKDQKMYNVGDDELVAVSNPDQ